VPNQSSVCLGRSSLPELINSPIFCTSKIISCVVTSAGESELGAAFQNAQKGAQFRNTLTELGYLQQATSILVDNTVAEGLATDTINAKRSKNLPGFSGCATESKNRNFHRTCQRKMECKRFFHETVAKGQI
jgi:hypothetical protein